MKFGRISKVIVPVAVLALLVTGCSDGSQGDGDQKEVIKVGTVHAMSWTAWTEAIETIDDPDIDVEVVVFSSSSNALLALQTGEIQMSSMSMDIVASALDKAKVPLKAVAGISPGQSNVIIRTGADIDSWEDMKGKRVGTIRGSTEYTKLQMALDAHGLDMEKDTELITVQSPSDLQLAMERGEIDVMTTYQPSAARTVALGIGTAPEDLNTYLNTVDAIPGDVVARDAFIEENPEALQKIINAYVAVWKEYEADKNVWVEDTLKFQQDDPEILGAALDEMAAPWWNLEQEKTTGIMAKLAEYGVLPSDTSKEIDTMFDYSFLAEATGLTPEELGKR